MNDLRGLIDCCPTQIAYVEGHQGGKASIKNVRVSKEDPFYTQVQGHCEFCGAEWIATVSRFNPTPTFKRATIDTLQDDEG